MNGISPDSYEIFIGDAIGDEALRARIGRGKYGLITANIVASVIIALLPLVREALMPEGVLIASGIIGERLAEVRAALEAGGFEVIEEHSDEDWRQLAARVRA